MTSPGRLKLGIELVPATSWYDNLRKRIGKEEWDGIRKDAYDRYGHRCGICNASGKLHCHELWGYDDARHIQKLAGFIALCEMCHHVKHIGLAGIMASRGEVDYDEVVRHFMSVNNCGKTAFYEHRDAAFEKWRIRSMHEWKVETGDFTMRKDGSQGLLRWMGE